jgi:hypothetical protein
MNGETGGFAWPSLFRMQQPYHTEDEGERQADKQGALLPPDLFNPSCDL